MAALRDRPIAEVVSKIELALRSKDRSTTVAPSSITQARQRVGSESLARLLERCSRY